MMVRMSERRNERVPWRVRCSRPAALVALVGALLLPACGGSSEPRAGAAPTGSTTPATTTTAATTITTTTTTTATTTLAPTTTSSAPPTTSTTSTTTEPITITSGTRDVQETEPIAPPADTYASEPVVDMGTISIPKIGVSMRMYEGIRMTTLDKGPGHWPGTALPGQVGNVVVGGHRTSKHRVFRNVDQLAPGDEIIFENAGGRHVYAVRKVEIVQPTAVWIVDPTPTPTATLFACHPPGSTAQRIVVFADLVST